MKSFDFSHLSASDVAEIHQLAEQGDYRMQYALGLMYEQGNQVPVNLDFAYSWYFQSATQGFAPAQNNLGLALEISGEPSQAFEWYKKAAEQGYPLAFENIGALYENGIGVEVLPSEAIQWYEKAYAYGRHEVAFNIGHLFHAMSEEHITQAIEWYLKAASQGNIHACYNIALIFYQGTPQVAPQHSTAFAILYLLSLCEHEQQAELDARIQPKLQHLYNHLHATDIERAKQWVHTAPHTPEQLLAHFYTLLAYPHSIR